ncbi:hypothetical protein VNO77_02694 [Canavalia gladiata]|uniref:Uncharacterized protein n=1 Tax=Canavalia gladiata TaxID=3824 RepID=A0AAN9MTE3_CANGL
MKLYLNVRKESDRITRCMVSHVRRLLYVLDENAYDGPCNQATTPLEGHAKAMQVLAHDNNKGVLCTSHATHPGSEADQMLVVGCEEDVEMILEKFLSQWQSIPFLATTPGWVEKLAKTIRTIC